MGPGLSVAVSVPHAVSLVALVTLEVVSRAFAGSNLGERKLRYWQIMMCQEYLDIPSVVKVGQLRATVTR